MSSNEKLLVGANTAGLYLFKVTNGNTRTMCEHYPELTMKTLERHH